MVFGVMPWLHDPINLPRLIILFSALPFLIYSTVKIDRKVETSYVELVFIFCLPTALLISTIFSKVDWIYTFLGQYQRNDGFIAYLILFVFVYVVSLHIKVSNLQIGRGYALILLAFSLYTLFQYMHLDIFHWSNPYNRMIGTVGNPDFAAAFMGMTSPIIFKFSKKSLSLVTAISWLGIFVLTLMSGALQGPLTATLSLLMFLTITETGMRKKKYLYIWSTIGAFGIYIVLGISNIVTLGPLKNFLMMNGSISQRLEYWRIGVKIFKLHPIFGVGPDSYPYYAPVFRTTAGIVRDGSVTSISNSHNVLIDMFANGGLIAGLAWISFVVFVNVKLYKVARTNRSKELAIVSSVWIGYLIQSFISVDNLVLAFVGMLSAGAILGIAGKEGRATLSKYSLPKKSVRDTVIKLTATVAAFFAVIVGLYLSRGDSRLSSALGNSTTLETNALSISQTYSNFYSDFLLGNALQHEGDFTKAKRVLENSIHRNPFYPNSRYLLGVSKAQLGQPVDALRDIQQALELEPKGTFFMVELGRLQLQRKQYNQARRTILLADSINPNEIGLRDLKNDYYQNIKKEFK
jgi:hypothetical protein